MSFPLPHTNPSIENVVDITELLGCDIDGEKLITEVKAAEKAHPFSKKTPGWHSIPLRSANGDMGEAGSRSFGIHNSGDVNVFKDTEIMKSTPYIRELLDRLGGKYLKVRIMKVLPNKAIAEHIDNFQAPDIIRVHIPVVTHPFVEFWVDKKCYYIPPEKLTYINVRRRHKVINRTKINRIHIVIDVKWEPEFAERFYSLL